MFDLIDETWLRPDQWIAGDVQVLGQEDDQVRLLRMTTSRVDVSQALDALVCLASWGRMQQSTVLPDRRSGIPKANA
jgi:hypothetical protein